MSKSQQHGNPLYACAWNSCDRALPCLQALEEAMKLETTSTNAFDQAERDYQAAEEAVNQLKESASDAADADALDDAQLELTEKAHCVRKAKKSYEQASAAAEDAFTQRARAATELATVRCRPCFEIPGKRVRLATSHRVWLRVAATSGHSHMLA